MVTSDADVADTTTRTASILPASSDRIGAAEVDWIAQEIGSKGKVAILKTTPETVLDDVRQVMRLAGYQEALPKDKDTILKINISWDTWYPACSSTPWQIEGVIQELQAAGYPRLIALGLRQHLRLSIINRL